LTNNKRGDTTLMAQRGDIMLGKMRHDPTHVTTGMELQELQTRTSSFGGQRMTVTETLPKNDQDLKVSATTLQEAIQLKNPVKVAIIIPTLNEERGIEEVIREIHRTLDEYMLHVSDVNNKVIVPIRPGIVVVDGGSTDNTLSVVKNKGETLVRQRGRGYGHALITGFKYAIEAFDPEVLVMMDADGTYDAADIPRLLMPILSDELDLVLGCRFDRMERDAMTSTNRIGNKILSWFAKRFLGVRVCDTQCGLRALAPDLVDIFNGQAKGMSFATEMLADAEQAGARIGEVSIVYRPRIGTTKLSPLHDGAKIVGIILRLLRDYKPLLFFGGLGFVSVFAGLTLGFDVILEYMSTGTVTKIPTAILTAFLLGAGVQLASLGLLADMIKGQKPQKRLPPTRYTKNLS
jgi:glycosyltransferase involved in cell wall biosynthesis